MGNCGGSCSCKETAKERKQRNQYMLQHNMNSKNKQPITNKPVSTSQSYSQTLSSTTTPTLTMNAKTMELLAPMEDIGLTPIETHEIIPDIMQSASFESVERNVTDIRIKALKSYCNNSEELEKKITEQYNEMDDDDDDDDDEIDDDDIDESMSSLSEEDRQEIEKRKSELLLIKINSNNSNGKAPNLLRDNTVSPWDDNDIEELECDMTQQLITLQNQMSNNSMNKKKNQRKKSNPHLNIPNYNKNNNYIDDNNEALNPPLFRNKSSDKWDAQSINATKDAMQKEMIHLMCTQIMSTSTSNT